MSRNQGIMPTLPFFPKFYKHELFYSALARYKVRCGVLSDKLLLADVFNKQTIVASPEMPNGIKRACTNIQPTIVSSPEEMIRCHTLFSLYTAFSEASIKSKIMAQMVASGANTYTTSTGLATCKLKPFYNFRYCPICIVEQIDEFGEAFWDRRWFGFYTYCCPMHGVKFISTDIAIHDTARHSFIPLLELLSIKHIEKGNVAKARRQDHLISMAAMKIMSHPLAENITFQQLTHFYQSLAIANNFNRGSQIKQSAVAAHINNFWTWRWLQYRGFTLDIFDYTMASMFRKHRKQQVYPVHLIAALPFFDGNIELWWNAITKLSKWTPVKNLKKTVTSKHMPTKQIGEWKTCWLALVEDVGPKAARYRNRASEKLYTALYRADRTWLLSVNQAHSIERPLRRERLSWTKRDYTTCRLLFSFLHQADDIYSPRRSRRWFLSQLTNMATIEHNLYRLPLTAMFLLAYSESFQDYQCRRLVQVTRECYEKNQTVKKWQLYRRARINTQRHISSQVEITCDWCFDWQIDHTK